MNSKLIKTLYKSLSPGLKPCLTLLFTPEPSHLLIAGFLSLAGGGGTAGGGRFGVAVFPDAVAVAGVVALLVRRGVVVFPLMRASAVMGSLSGGSWVRCRLSWCTCGGGQYCWGKGDVSVF